MDKYAHLKKQAREKRKEERMCISKKAYETMDEAELNGQDSYKCPYCEKFHGTQKKKKFLNRYQKRIQKLSESGAFTLEDNKKRVEEIDAELKIVSIEIGKLDKKLNALEHQKNQVLREKRKLEKKMSHNSKYKNRLIKCITKQTIGGK